MPASASAVAEPETALPLPEAPTPEQATKPKRQPRYHVVLWNDDDHTYHYVVAMLQKLFGHPTEKGFQLAKQVDRQGRAIVLTTTLEHAELKRDQIRSFGFDRMLARSKGSMAATIEAEPTA
jgi:ATP-dependent Clp protease adaptor protein ClpS